MKFISTRIIPFFAACLLFLLFNPGKHSQDLQLSFETPALAYRAFRKTTYFPKIYAISAVLFKFPSGVWRIPKHASFFQIIRIFDQQKPIDLHQKITFIDGTNAKQIENIINTHPDLTGPAITLTEAEIFPDTYYFTKGCTRTQLIAIAKQHMQKKCDELWQQRPKNFPLKQNEWIILASIVQKEGKFYSDMQQIAAVFLLRLKKKMPLQSDACIVYGMDLKTDRVFHKHLKFDSPYNTYKYKHLPPTAICMPSLNALNAVLNANLNEKNLYFYTVNYTKNDKQIFEILFAKTFNEHINNKRILKAKHKI